jgi:hypothetical protein
MHCVAGDGVGILAGAVVGSFIHLPPPVEMALEYLLGFGFGWTMFQALFMRDMAGGSFVRSMQLTFSSELLSMNVLMGGMLPVAAAWRAAVAAASDSSRPEFWFSMSIALLVGFVADYPINWWLVTRGLKHGMKTVWSRASTAPGEPMHATAHGSHGAQAQGHQIHMEPAPAPRMVPAAVISLSVLAIGVAVALTIGG